MDKKLQQQLESIRDNLEVVVGENERGIYADFEALKDHAKEALDKVRELLND